MEACCRILKKPHCHIWQRHTSGPLAHSDDTDAEDVVQEAYLRALRHFRQLSRCDGRPWLLAIVRNTCYTWMQHNRSPQLTIP